MTNLTKDRLFDFVNSIAKKCDFITWRYICHENINKIENYFGVLVPLTVIGHKENSVEEIETHVLMKLKPYNVEERVKPILKYLFEAEHFLYTSLMPMYMNFYEGNMDELVPTCYYADLKSDNEVIILQDMTYKDYRRYLDHRFLDYDHSLVSLKALANFHSLHLILIEKGGRVDDNGVLKPYTDTYPLELNITLKLALKNHSKFFKNSKYEHYLSSLTERFSDVRANSIKKARCLVYGHGDYWKENILFKYESNKPIKACILDFQTLHLMSPSEDLLSFLIFSLATETRTKYFVQFLKIYLETVALRLKENGIELKSFEDNVKHDLKVVGDYCVIRSFMAFALWYGLEEETLIKSKNPTSKQSAATKFTQTVGNILDDLFKFELITL